MSTTTTATTTTTSSTSAHGWPWMQHEKHAINLTPDPPTCDQDDRPAVSDLIQQHRDKIDALRQKLQDNPLFIASKHDDLWLLRFLMSHKGSLKHALKAAQHTLQFRHDHKLDEMGDIRKFHFGVDTQCPLEGANRYHGCCDNDTSRFVVLSRCVVCYVQWRGLDQPKLLQTCQPEDWLQAFCFLTEWSFQWVDYLTRTSGRLTKTIRIIDCHDMTLQRNGCLTCAHRDATAINHMEDCYPQLLQALYVVDAPFYISGPWKALRPLMPKRVLEKFDFLQPLQKKKHLQKLLKHIDVQDLPTRLGGQKENAWPDNTPPPV